MAKAFIKILDIVQSIGEEFFQSAKEVWQLFFPEGVEVGPGDIPASHMIYEYFGHRIAYLNAGSSLVGNDAEIMRAAGYNPDSIDWTTGSYGLQMASIMPDNKAGGEVKKPMVAFRGTLSVQGVITDFNFNQVGQDQYYENEAKINSFADKVGGSRDVMGHSLGGAMAQIYTANNSGKVSNCITFNSPGISASEIEKYENATAGQNEEDRPTMTHHIAPNDIVSGAGEKNLEGDVYRHDNENGGNPIAAHTSYFFNHEQYDGWREDLGIQDEYEDNIGLRDGEYDVMRYETHPQELVRTLLFEPGRKLVSVMGHMVPIAVLGLPGPVIASLIKYLTRNKDIVFTDGPSR